MAETTVDVVASATEAVTAAANQKVVLVTGGSGLVGRAVQHVVNEDKNTDKYIFLSSKDGDLRKMEQCEAIFEKYKPTHVLHLAAFVGGLFRNMAYPVDFWNNNVNMNNNIMECCHKHNVTKLVSCLSTCIFPDKTPYPITETMIHNGPPHSSNAPYAYAKRMIDIQNKAYHQQYKRMFTSVIPTNIYGPHDNWNLKDGHVIPALIHKCYNANRDGTEFLCFGSGKPLRQFIFSHDLARLMVWTIDNYNSVEPLILSVDDGAEISIKDVVDSIVEAMDFKGTVKWDTSKADGQYKKTASNDKLRGLHPTFKFTSFKDGIEKTVKWFVENYETCRK